ncbi:hypothetical protein K502DRAFT_343887 [Neoconidiobolus thromboides FSU 785]|nr:hypothetical protein K502DRAFT_343887 [Neoconidiobolus thromboides FSU 785]
MIQIKQSVLHNRLPFNITRIGLLMNCSNLENGDIIEDIDNEEIQKENLRPLKILKDGLRSCLVYRGLLKLSLRFGKICFLDLPKKLVFPSHDFQQRVLNNPNFTSDFSRNIFYGQSNKFNELLIQLSTEGHEYLNNPQTIYTLKCDCINLFDKNEFDLNLCFDNSKLIKYDCISPYKLTTAINWCFVEDDNSLDFQLGLEKAVRLDIHNPDLIEFIKNLNLSAAGQFSYCNTSKIKVRSIIKKVRHCYELQRYKFQATKSELWIFEHKYLTNTFKHVIQSVDIQPNIITVDLKIINESWNSYFTQNLNLKKGNIVEYDYRNVMSNEDYSKLIKLAINWRHKINEL